MQQAPDRPRRGLDRALHRAFEASLALKAALAAVELAAGLALWLVGGAGAVRLVERLTQAEITRHPADRLAAALLRATASWDLPTEHFYAAYLAGHGVIKLALVAGLLRGARWSYPVSLAALALFVAYQLHRWAATGSLPMLALTVFDLIVMALIAREWRHA